MTSRKRAKALDMIRKTALDPIRWYHPCLDCVHFFRESRDLEGLHRNYCAKRMRHVRPSQNACTSFLLRITETRRGKRRFAITEENRSMQCMAHQMMQDQTGTSEPLSLVEKKGRCIWCHREFTVYARQSDRVRQCCSKRCRTELKKYRNA